MKPLWMLIPASYRYDDELSPTAVLIIWAKAQTIRINQKDSHINFKSWIVDDNML